MITKSSYFELPKSHTMVDLLHLALICMENWVIWLAENCKTKEWKPIEASTQGITTYCLSFPDILWVILKATTIWTNQRKSSDFLVKNFNTINPKFMSISLCTRKLQLPIHSPSPINYYHRPISSSSNGNTFSHNNTWRVRSCIQNSLGACITYYERERE